MAAPGFKKWGGKKGGNDWLWGGKHVRVAHIASAKREPIFLNCWGPIFFGQTCARSAHSERVSASRFWVGSRARLRAPGGVQGQSPCRGSRGRAPGRFWIYAFQSPKIAVFESHLVTFWKAKVLNAKSLNLLYFLHLATFWRRGQSIPSTQYRDEF